MAGSTDALAGTQAGIGVQDVLAAGQGGPTQADYRAPADRVRRAMEEARQANTEATAALGRIDQWEMSEHDHATELRNAALAGLPQSPKPTPSPQFQPTDPMKAWGSAAMMLAMLGSALTRTPMNSALNAAGAALKAMHQNDVDTFNIQFKRWQMETTNAEKMYQYEMTGYQKQLAELDRQEGVSAREASGLRASVTAAMRATANSFGDEKMAAALTMQGLSGAEKLLQDRRQWLATVAQHQGPITEMADEYTAVQSYKASPEGQELIRRMQAGDASASGEFIHGLIEREPRVVASVQKAQATGAEKIINDTNKTAAGQLYAMQEKVVPVINTAIDEMKKTGTVDATTQAQLIEASQKVLTGQAIRGFMVTLSQEGVSYSDRLQRLVQGLDPNSGTHLPNDQLANIIRNASAVISVTTQHRRQEVDAAADRFHQVYDGDPNVIYESLRGGSKTVTPSAELPDGGAAPAASAAPSRGGGETRPNVPPYHAPLAWTDTPTLFQQAVGQFFPGHQVVVNPEGGRRDHSSGSVHSEHLGTSPLDRAYDFHVTGMSYPIAAMKLAANMIGHQQPFDQILIEGNHVHVGWGTENRQQLGVKPQPGRTGVHPIEPVEIEGAHAAHLINDAEYQVLMGRYGGQ